MKADASTKQHERWQDASVHLRSAHRKMRILGTIAWPAAARDRFFARGQRELPRVTYKGFDATEALEEVAAARALLRGKDPITSWLRRTATTLDCTAQMLAGIGTRAFSTQSQRLYGTPATPFPHTDRTPLDMAQRLIRSTRRAHRHMPAPPPEDLSARDVATQIRRAVQAHFGTHAPEVVIVPGMAARAAAGPTRIRLRRGAKFSDLDVIQLIQHEAFVHTGTSINGGRQKKMGLLAANHAGTTRTQEGLAVFAELISGALDPRRLLRIAHRVIAVDMALQDADFFDVYEYFREHSANDVEAYESAARVFRGGLPSGGAPFTKDMVYLDGLCRVHVFLRALVDRGRLDCLPMLFAGKCDLDDLNALVHLRSEGLLASPRFVPRWVRDARRVVAYFSVTDVIGPAAAAGLRKHYAQAFDDLPTEEPEVGKPAGRLLR